MKTIKYFFLCCLSFNLFAAERPTIGLVLSGGGAKGAAHVGVIKVLEANQIPVDYIAGTSIGAFVGGLYALGYTADEIEKVMLHTDWSEGYSDNIPREDLSYRNKQQKDKYNIPLSVGYSDGELKVPSGLLQGQTMSMLIRNATNLIPEFTSFSDLAIPYRAVATDLATSKGVVLSSGSLVQAMQASASVPGALQPIKLNGHLLVDGGIANNMPVNVAKAMGADIVIAVDIGSSLKDAKDLDSTVAVLTQLSTMLTNASTEQQKKLLTDKDILIRPEVGNLSTTDFSIMSEALALGIDAANQQLDKLKSLSTNKAAFQDYLAHKKVYRAKWQADLTQPVVQITLNNQSKISDELIFDTLGITKGKPVNKRQLDAAINRVYALNLFAKVDAAFEEQQNGRKLIVTTKEKSWGPNYFQLGLNWEDDFSHESAVSVDLAYTMTNLTDNGGRWRNKLRLGTEKLIGTGFYQPLDPDDLFYATIDYRFEIYNWDYYENNNLVTQLNKRTHVIETALGYNFVNSGRIELGYAVERGEYSNKYYLPDDSHYSSYGGFIKFGYDSLDSISFPTHGNRLNLNVYLRREDFLNSPDNSVTNSMQIEADWKGALSLGNHTFVGKAAFATVEKDGLFSVHLSQLGGFLNLSGLHKNALVGPHKLFGALSYQYDLGKELKGFNSMPFYLGTSLEAGNIWNLRESVTFNDLIYASSIYIGTNTQLGPSALGFGITDKGDRSIYLFLGKNF